MRYYIAQLISGDKNLCKLCHPCKVSAPGDVTSLQSYAPVFNSNDWTLFVIPRQEVYRFMLIQHNLVYNDLNAKSISRSPGCGLCLTHLKAELSLIAKYCQRGNTFWFHTKRNEEVWYMSETCLCTTDCKLSSWKYSRYWSGRWAHQQAATKGTWQGKEKPGALGHGVRQTSAEEASVGLLVRKMGS